MTVVLHEIGHGLGFAGGCRQHQQLNFLVCENQPNSFDENLTDNLGVSPSLVPTTSATEEFLQSDNVFFDTNYKLFSPLIWQQGRSIYHLDQTVYSNSGDALMTPDFRPGRSIHDGGFVTRYVMNEIGWDITAIGLHEANGQENNLRVYPNPAKNWMRLELADQIIEEIKLFNLHGQLVKKWNAKKNQVTLLVSEIESGLYLLCVTTNQNQVINRKFLIK